MNLLRVPGKDPADVMAWRIELRTACAQDSQVRAAVRRVCKDDPLYWLNAFCFLFEPRPRYENGVEMPKIIPFITWPHQDKVIKEICENLGKRDIGVLKSRAEGASWIGALLGLHNWLFHELSTIGVVSRNLLAADNPDDPDSVMWKVDWELTKLPVWMSGKKDVDYKRDRGKHVIKNLRNGSTIAAYAATGDVASGGRKAWMLAQPYSASVLTPSGWSRMGDLRIGHEVVGKNGRPCKVTRIFEHGSKPVYKVTFSDGSHTRCCDDHLWVVNQVGRRHCNYKHQNKRSSRWRGVDRKMRWERKPLSEIRKDYLQSNGKWKKAAYSIPMCDPVEYAASQLPLHPYLVGAWIGDGYVGTHMCFASDDDFVVDRLSGMMPDGVELVKQRHQVYAPRGAVDGRSPLKQAFQELDMCRTGTAKRIPEMYLRAPVADRIQLLHGLMDTDGTCQGKVGDPKSFCTFTTISKGLADDMIDLVCGLGGHAKVRQHESWCVTKSGRVAGKPHYKVNVALPSAIMPFSLPRKLERYKPRSKYPVLRTIVEIARDGEEQCRCITVDAEDHLYLTDFCIVTSNCDELAKFGQPDDEEAMASTQYVTDSRLIVSTPKGASGAYYELMHEPSNLVKVVLAWEENPTKNRGLYRFVKGRPVAVDKKNPLPPEYDPPTEQIEALFARLKRKGFNLESGVRSPWYDQECDRPRATPQAVAQELDRDFGGSSYRIFTQEIMSKVDETICPPFKRGEMLRTTDGWQFSERSDGSVKLWCELDLQGDPPKRGYVVGCDICAGLAGSYTSNSVIQVIDSITRTQVLEFACNNMQPAEFADVAIDIARWFHGAFLAWESNGIGGAFSSRVLERRYFNLFKKPILNQKKKVVSNKLGWYTSKDTKEMLFSDLIISIKQERLTIRCGEIVDEMNQYVRINGKIECITAVKSSVDADKGEAHGDRVMALGIALQALKERPVPVKYEDPAQPTGAEPPLGTMARRMYEAAKSVKEEAYWDDRMGHELTKSYS